MKKKSENREKERKERKEKKKRKERKKKKKKKNVTQNLGLLLCQYLLHLSLLPIIWV